MVENVTYGDTSNSPKENYKNLHGNVATIYKKSLVVSDYYTLNEDNAQSAL